MSGPARRRVDAPAAAALVVLLPAVAAALALVALEAGRARQPEDPLFDGPPPRSLARAILDDDVQGAFAFFRNGQDPNLPVDAALPDATTGRDRAVHMTPLVLAVSAGNMNSVHMLLSVGVDMTRPENQLALCVARQRHDADMTTLLLRVVRGEPACSR